MEIHESWKLKLADEFKKPYFQSLEAFVNKEYDTYTCYPKKSEIFAAFNYTPFTAVKVVLIGQDPYHGGQQANGLCFSVNDGIPHPPSLQNIFKELSNDIGTPYSTNGNLESWAKQGVLLLNTTLTVRAGEAGSHQKKGWETFTDSIIKKLSKDQEALIFLLWGGFAQKKAKLIDAKKHSILTAGHPSPLSANRGYWFGNGHFSKTNKKLVASGQSIIRW